MGKGKVLIGLLLVLMAAAGWLWYHRGPAGGRSAATEGFRRGHNVPGQLYWAGTASEKKAELTFDDGPEAHWTPRILDILRDKGVRATFFVIGRQVEKYPAILQRIAAEGHIIGDHTFNHVDLTKLTPAEVEKELDDCAAAIEKTIGKRPRFIRPPYGFRSSRVDEVVKSRGRVVVLWSLDSEDWQGPDAATVRSRIVPKMQNGFIVLQHDGENPKLGGSLAALPGIIDELQGQGYTFVTIEELLEIGAYQ